MCAAAAVRASSRARLTDSLTLFATFEGNHRVPRVAFCPRFGGFPKSRVRINFTRALSHFREYQSARRGNNYYSPTLRERSFLAHARPPLSNRLRGHRFPLICEHIDARKLQRLSTLSQARERINAFADSSAVACSRHGKTRKITTLPPPRCPLRMNSDEDFASVRRNSGRKCSGRLCLLSRDPTSRCCLDGNSHSSRSTARNFPAGGFDGRSELLPSPVPCESVILV